MKKLISLSVTFIVFISMTSAQEFQGQAIYQSKTKIEIKLDSSRVSSERQKRFQEMLKKQFEKTYELNFNKTASIYKEQAKLEQPGGGSGRMRFMMMGSGSSGGIYYKDIRQKIYANQNEVFGKNFLIKDTLSKLNWKLEKESKMIGNYLCFKATTTKLIKDVGFSRLRRRNNKDNKPKDSLPKTVEVTAWYTPQIPVSQGPKDFWGLPGLILEVNYAKTMLLCTKIVLNPKEKKSIKIPDKGKVVSQAEYDKIMKKKMKEMRERYGGGRRNGRDVHVRFN
jgi:GLPGLI family protein